MFSACHSPAVWYPKDRRKVLSPPIEERLKQILHAVCQGHQAQREELDDQAGHGATKACLISKPKKERKPL